VEPYVVNMNISAVVKETAPLCNYKKGRR